MLIPKVFALNTPDVLIVELMVRSAATTGAADQEFVELYNTTANAIDVSAWKLQYKSATGSAWTDKATLHGSIAAHSHYLLVSDKFPNPPTANSTEPALAVDTFSAGLSDSGGHVRIADLTVPALPIVHDTLGWGSTANAAEGKAPATAPAGGKSLKRRAPDGKFQDTDNNSNDFEVSSDPTPQADALYVAPVIVLDPISTTPSPSTSKENPSLPIANSTALPAEQPAQPAVPPETSPAASVTLLSPQITELLPNPAAPASDSKDEYIELYNPNDQPLELTGYKLQSGSTFSYSYTFPSVTLAPHQYMAFMITETGDILSNTNGQARVLDTSGAVVSLTNVYDHAGEGEAWALINGTWQWTITPTPNESNVLTLPAMKAVGVVKAPISKTTSVKSTPAKTTTPKTIAPKTTGTKSPSAVKVASTKAKSAAPAAGRQSYQKPAATPAPLHPGILAGVGLITLVYAAYEYRYDAINTVRRLRRYREVRRATRAASAGR